MDEWGAEEQLHAPIPRRVGLRWNKGIFLNYSFLRDSQLVIKTSQAFNITDPLISEVFENWADNQPSGMRDNKGAGGCIVFRVGTKEGRSTDDVP